MAATAESLQREVEALQACCPILCPSIVPNGYETHDLVALMQDAGRESTSAFEELIQQAASEATTCCVCGADGNACGTSGSGSDGYVEGEDGEADQTLFFTVITGIDFKSRNVVLQRAGFACVQCRALRSTCRMIRFAVLRVGEEQPQHQEPDTNEEGGGDDEEGTRGPGAHQRLLLLAAHLASLNGAPEGVQSSPEALAVWLQELYCRSYALQVVASNLGGWRAVGPDGQPLSLGLPKGVVAAARLLLRGGNQRAEASTKPAAAVVAAAAAQRQQPGSRHKRTADKAQPQQQSQPTQQKQAKGSSGKGRAQQVPAEAAAEEEEVEAEAGTRKHRGKTQKRAAGGEAAGKQGAAGMRQGGRQPPPLQQEEEMEEPKPAEEQEQQRAAKKAKKAAAAATREAMAASGSGSKPHAHKAAVTAPPLTDAPGFGSKPGGKAAGKVGGASGGAEAAEAAPCQPQPIPRKSKSKRTAAEVAEEPRGGQRREGNSDGDAEAAAPAEGPGSKRAGGGSVVPHEESEGAVRKIPEKKRVTAADGKADGAAAPAPAAVAAAAGKECRKGSKAGGGGASGTPAARVSDGANAPGVTKKRKLAAKK